MRNQSGCQKEPLEIRFELKKGYDRLTLQSSETCPASKASERGFFKAGVGGEVKRRDRLLSGSGR